MVERSPLYAPLLNAEPLTSHADDSQLSAGCREAEPAHVGFSCRGLPAYPAEVIATLSNRLVSALPWLPITAICLAQLCKEHSKSRLIKAV